MTPAVALTIAGSDSGGGAGIQADLKTFAALRTYGASVITAVTAQNTLGVTAVHEIPADIVGAQLDAVLDDLPVAAVKIGMVTSVAVAEAIAARLGRLPNVVLDPVLTATTGRRLGLITTSKPLLLYATVVTPNRAEASELVGWPVHTPAEMARAAAEIGSRGPRAVVVTGSGEADVLWTRGGVHVLDGRPVDTRNDHGTGCTYSSAIAARLAAGDEVVAAVKFARGYVTGALTGGRDWNIGRGAGPLDHFGW